MVGTNSSNSSSSAKKQRAKKAARRHGRRQKKKLQSVTPKSVRPGDLIVTPTKASRLRTARAAEATAEVAAAVGAKSPAGKLSGGPRSGIERLPALP